MKDPKCGKKLNSLFSKDTIFLIVWRGNQQPVIDTPNAKYGVRELSNYYLEVI